MDISNIERAYESAKARYFDIGVNTDKVMEILGKVSISLNCWNGDDVTGFEEAGETADEGGIKVTGNYPGRARTIDELQSDLSKAYSLIPGNHRLNLHAIYGDFTGAKVDRDEISQECFPGWIEWAKNENLKLDFNSTCFAHPKADSGFTLSSKDKNIRDFWIEHVKRCREISAYIGRELKSPCIHNLWVPDGSKDMTMDRFRHRELLKESLDQIYTISYTQQEMKDAVESKLFGIGSESFVAGSHEFYMGVALEKKIMVCIDIGHFHPTESAADKISSILQFSDELLLHVSRGVRWDSDHVVILNDDLRYLFEEIVRADILKRVNIALDFFDASINRIGGWVISMRATLKALMLALLEPGDLLREYENSGNYFARLALLEEVKTMPFGAVWDYFCLRMDVPVGDSWISEVLQYEEDVTGKRG
ncbi:MAG: L-rhamnose isomerase [bacterium]|nr:L-rhamnose isomerase [bacterium]